MRIFVLEDDRQRNLLFREAAIGLDATFAVSYGEARLKYTPPYDVLFLDHDLGDRVFVPSSDENTGATFARWLPVCTTTPATTAIVHSYNPDGAETMRDILTKKGYDVHVIPFGKVVLNIMQGLATNTVHK